MGGKKKALMQNMHYIWKVSQVTKELLGVQEGHL